MSTMKHSAAACSVDTGSPSLVGIGWPRRPSGLPAIARRERNQAEPHSGCVTSNTGPTHRKPGPYCKSSEKKTLFLFPIRKENLSLIRNCKYYAVAFISGVKGSDFS